MKSPTSLTIPIILFLLIGFSGCEKYERVTDSTETSAYSGDFLRKFYDLQCQITKETPGFFPPQAARAFSYVGLTGYEAVVHGIPNAKSLAGQLNGLSANALPQPEVDKAYNWAIVANAASAEMMRKMFELNLSEQNLQKINEMEDYNYSQLYAANPLPVADRSVAFGRAIAEAIYQYSMTDGGHQAYLDAFQLPYILPVGDHCWIPTGATVHPICPYWGECRPFLNQNVVGTQPPQHLPHSADVNSDFYAAAMEVYNQVNNNSAEQIEIARFWADDPFQTCTPAGHTFNLLSQLLEEDDATLAKTAVGYAKLGIAENDAFISCWKSKYDFVLVRPFTYIRQHIDPNFNTVIGTPPFPAYSSGHSCEIGVGETVFTEMFTNGDGKYELSDRTGLQFGFGIRHFSSFSEMAEECANSRFYGGIHYQMDNTEGLVTGRKIGYIVLNQIQWPEVN
ncbi:MAG: vanadium-dependent haloperoxidase [Flavobacteriales bacterium]|nr:vanadium-dependent haloperoxidase [Flavobacteriales bacterium]